MARDARLADLGLLLKAIAPTVREALREATDPLIERIRALEAREAVPGPAGVAGAPGAAGVDGLPGRDGFGFDDLAVAYDGERDVTLTFTRGEARKDYPLRFPVPIFRGAYVPDTAYERGDAVVYAGSTWIAKRDTRDRPDEHAADRAWQLSAKRGKDGRAP